MDFRWNESVSDSDLLWRTKKDFFTPRDRTGPVIHHQRVQGVTFLYPKEVFSCTITQHLEVLDASFNPEVDKNDRDEWPLKQTRTKDWGNGRKITKSLLLLVTYGHGFFKFIIQKAKGGFKMRCFYVIGARLWNDVNINLKVDIFLFRKEWSLKLFWRATNVNFLLLEGSIITVKNVG